MCVWVDKTLCMFIACVCVCVCVCARVCVSLAGAYHANAWLTDTIASTIAITTTTAAIVNYYSLLFPLRVKYGNDSLTKFMVSGRSSCSPSVYKCMFGEYSIV